MVAVVQTISENRISESTDRQVFHVLVPQILKEAVKVVKLDPQERVQQWAANLFVELLVLQIMEDISEVPFWQI